MTYLQKHYFMLTYPATIHGTYRLKNGNVVSKEHLSTAGQENGGAALERIYTVHVSNFEYYCLRTLLNVIQDPTNFLDLKAVDGQELKTFRQAYDKLG
ncbi:uncharacterized protein TNCV_1383271 [Trichonephila clavipes]|nr:uncharacterized protein TNCV_1383271 [Trichonephila clavipes]